VTFAIRRVDKRLSKDVKYKIQHMSIQIILASTRHRTGARYALLLGGLLALPGPCVTCKFQSFLRGTAQHTTTAFEGNQQRNNHSVRLTASCPEHHEYRLGAASQTTLVAKSQSAALPVQLTLNYSGSVVGSPLTLPALTGPAPPLLVSRSPRAPPLTFPRV